MMQNKKQLYLKISLPKKKKTISSLKTTNEQFIGKFGRVHEYETEFCNMLASNNPLLNSSPGIKNVLLFRWDT